MPKLDLLTRSKLEAQLRSGATDRAAARAAGVNHVTAANLRRRLGLPPAEQPPNPRRDPRTLPQKFRDLTETDADGHMRWTGLRNARGKGAPIVHWHGKVYATRAVAFEIQHGRPPVGSVLPECGQAWCVAPAHVEDQPGRDRVREQLAALTGVSPGIDVCKHGHDQTVHGARYPDGTPYCRTCTSVRGRAHKRATRGAAA